MVSLPFFEKVFVEAPRLRRGVKDQRALPELLSDRAQIANELPLLARVGVEDLDQALRDPDGTIPDQR
jgi:hypothetical protein